MRTKKVTPSRILLTLLLGTSIEAHDAPLRNDHTVPTLASDHQNMQLFYSVLNLMRLYLTPTHVHTKHGRMPPNDSFYSNSPITARNCSKTWGDTCMLLGTWCRFRVSFPVTNNSTTAFVIGLYLITSLSPGQGPCRSNISFTALWHLTQSA